MKKAKWFIGLPFSIVGAILVVPALAFCVVACLLGHTYWNEGFTTDKNKNNK